MNGLLLYFYLFGFYRKQAHQRREGGHSGGGRDGHGHGGGGTKFVSVAAEGSAKRPTILTGMTTARAGGWQSSCHAPSGGKRGGGHSGGSGHGHGGGGAKFV